MNEARWANISKARLQYESQSDSAAKYPIEAFFEVSARCNLHCQMCAINYDSRYQPRSGRPPFFEPDLFSRLRPIFPYLHRAYLFGLGEPTLNRHLVDYIRELSEAGVEVWFNTNATLIDEARAEEIAAAGAQRITVSIDGATAATYETIRRGAKFDAVIAGIRALVAAGQRHGRPDVNLSFVAMASNIHELPFLVDLAADLGTYGIHVEPLFQQTSSPDLMDHYSRENLGVHPAEGIAMLFGESELRAKARGITLATRFARQQEDFDYVERAKHLDVDWVCSEPWSSIWVTSAGEVRTCCVNDTSFGNVFETSFEEIWTGAAYREFRQAHAKRVEPAGCGNCIRNGRQRQSPFFTAVTAVTYRPLERDLPRAENAIGIFDTPCAGQTLTDPLVITGRVWTDINDVELMIDETAIGLLRDIALTDLSSFTLSAEVPFLTEGAHVVWLRRRGFASGSAHREFFFWRPEATDLRATNRAIFTAPRGIGFPKLMIDGGEWHRTTWSRAANAGTRYFVANADFDRLAPGAHDVEIRSFSRRIARTRLQRLPT